MDRIVRLVYERSGITLHDGKRALAGARLHKPLKAGGFRSFSDYVRHVETDRTGHELSVLIDAISTNHTSFFREDEHFRYLAQQVVPALLAAARPGRVWCAAWSTGQEPGAPPPTRKAYFDRGLGAAEGKVRGRAHVRRTIEYRRLNLIEIDSLNETFD